MFNTKMLNEVNDILNSKYSFELYEITDDTPEGMLILAVIQARIITEGICRYVILYEQLVKNEEAIRTATLSVFLNRLRPAMYINKTILNHMRIIQDWSNQTAHFQINGAIGYEEAKSCMSSLEQIAKWFIDNYRGTSIALNRETDSFSIDRKGVIPQKVEGCIISRQNETALLHDHLARFGTVVICGRSGTGKTELCKDYVSSYGNEYDGVYYVENPSGIDQFIIDLPFRINGTETASHDQIFRDKLNMFRELEGKYLYILDNYEEPGGRWIEQLISNQQKYHLLVTCTKERMDGAIDTITIAEPSMSDCFRLFEYFYPIPVDTDELEVLIDRLERNLRLIKMCAVYLYSRKDETNLSEFIQEFDVQKDEMESTLKKICDIMLKQLQLESTRGQVLHFLSLIPYSGMPYSVFREWCIEALKPEIKKNDNNKDKKTAGAVIASEREIDAVLRDLEEENWFIKDENDCLVVSQMVSDVLYEKMKYSLYSSQTKRFIDPVLKVLDKILDCTYEKIHMVEPFVNQLSTRALYSDYYEINSKNERDIRREILLNLRDYYIALYKPQSVDALVVLINKVIGESEANERLIEAEWALYREGVRYLNFEQFDKAGKCFSESIKRMDEKIQNIKKNLAIATAQYGHALAFSGKTGQAIEVCKRSVELRAETNPNALWISYYNLALALYKAGQFEDAMVNCNDAMVRFQQIYPENHSYYYNLSSPLHLKGQIECEQGLYDKAIEDLMKAAEVRKLRSGEKTYWMAQIYEYLCDVYERSGQFDKAVSSLKKSIEIKSRMYISDAMHDQINKLQERMNRLTARIEHV